MDSEALKQVHHLHEEMCKGGIQMFSNPGINSIKTTEKDTTKIQSPRSRLMEGLILYFYNLLWKVSIFLLKC